MYDLTLIRSDYGPRFENSRDKHPVTVSRNGGNSSGEGTHWEHQPRSDNLIKFDLLRDNRNVASRASLCARVETAGGSP